MLSVGWLLHVVALFNAKSDGLESRLNGGYRARVDVASRVPLSGAGCLGLLSLSRSKPL
jgi:hypothetical protein